MDLNTVERRSLSDPTFRPVAAAMRVLAPHFTDPWELWAETGVGNPGSALISILFRNTEDSRIAPPSAIELHVYPTVIEIPKVLLPDHLRHQALMYRTLQQVVHVGEEDGQHVVISQCVNRYKRSLLARGAMQTPNVYDAVVLNPDMDFGLSKLSSSPPLR